jgi:histone H3/H4
MPRSLLSLLLAIFLSLALLGLLVLAAEGLRWLAGRNCQRRDTLGRAARELERERAELARGLAAFRSLESAVYRDGYHAAVEPLRLAATGTPDGLVFPGLTTGGLALFQFLARPAATLGLLRTAWGLHLWGQDLAGSRAHLTAARAELLALQALPRRFRAEAAALAERLTDMLERLRAEQAAGVEGAAAHQTAAVRLADRAAALTEAFTEADRLSPRELDQMARTLAAAAEAAGRLEEDTRRLEEGRRALDAAYREAESMLIEARGRSLPESFRDQNRRLLQQAENCLAEAQHRRAQAAFPVARLRLEEARQWLAAAGNAATLLNEADWLQGRRRDAIAPEEVDRVLRQTDDHLRALVLLLPEGESGQPLGSVERQRLVACSEALGALGAEAVALQQREEAATRQLTERGHQQLAQMRATWESMQAALPIDPADRLARKVRAVERRWAEAAGRPARMQAIVSEAAVLAADLAESTAFLLARLEAAEAGVADLPERVSEAEEAARDWPCLQQPLNAVKESSLRAHHLWSQSLTTGSLSETHSRLDDLKLAATAARETADILIAGAARLRRSANLYLQTRDAAERAVDSDPARRHRLLRLARIYYDQAHRDALLEDALESMRKAEECAREVVKD